MSNIKRLFQTITGFHRIHDIFNSYGYKIPFTKYGYFDDYGLLKTTQFHNCTKTKRY